MSQSDPRLSKALTAHSSIVAALNVIHSLRTRGLRRTLLFATLGNGIPILGELLAIHVLKVLRHYIQPQTRGVPLAIALGWYNVGCGTLAAVNRDVRLLLSSSLNEHWTLTGSGATRRADERTRTAYPCSSYGLDLHCCTCAEKSLTYRTKVL